MSLLSTVEQAIKSCKAEQAKINDSIQLYREIMQTLTSRPKIALKEVDSADDAPTDTDASLGEKEDIELLEQALEKALHVRTGTRPKKAPSKQSAPQKEMSTAAKEGGRAPAASKGKQTTRRTFKSTGFDRKHHTRPGRKSEQVVSAFGSPSSGQLHTQALNSKEESVGSTVLSVNDLGKAQAISKHTLNNTAPASRTGESGAHHSTQQSWIPSDEIAKWKSLRRKKNRMWDKVAALQRRPAPGRSHFMERMRATFPKDLPHGSPDQTRALVNRVTHQGLNLAWCYQTEELLSKQTPEAATELGTATGEWMQIKAAELHNIACQVKQEWEAWDRWRPEGGCLCPLGASGVLGDGVIAPLLSTITYRTEVELLELEKLRMRVALLQQEMDLEQALLDTLSPQLSSIVSGAGGPAISVLRDVYSLLGEGGQRFPAIVLDAEPD